VDAVAILNQQFASLVLIRLHKKESRGQVSPEPVTRVDLANRVVHVCAEVLSAFVLVEERRAVERKSLSILATHRRRSARDQVQGTEIQSLST
jgi:hypothetical protein